MHTDRDACLRAIAAKDARFDGLFFTGVTSTGIYCRPSCPARTPAPGNVEFYPTAAAAQLAGFRACKRCIPGASPGSPEWDVRGDAVARAVRLIDDGVVDREGVPGLAARLGYSVRQVQRLLADGAGAGPVALARARRAQSARTLIEATDLPLTDVTLAAREPFCPCNVFGHLIATRIDGVEAFADGAYHRTLRLPIGWGVASLAPAPRGVRARVGLTDVSQLPTAVARLRRMLDLDADPAAVDAHLSLDPPRRRRPGPRARCRPGGGEGGAPRLQGDRAVDRRDGRHARARRPRRVPRHRPRRPAVRPGARRRRPRRPRRGVAPLALVRHPAPVGAHAPRRQHRPGPARVSGDPMKHSVLGSPIGPLTVVEHDGSLVGVYMEGHTPFPAYDLGPLVDDALPSASAQLTEYFDGRRQAFDLPLAPVGTAFQRSVWDLIAAIPFGETRTYGELATALGRPSGARAVGTATGRNPISIVVPCHRVVGATGTLTGYAGGVERKAFLLDHESPDHLL
ncbi:MAG TPA: methylated-DNA--[protein]-cysteine S-methyltransferase [Arachnia sp.]|nr:methylated-DNA--[protein]-cysteine S-methyltransferase [Arachnia sp.]